MATVKVARRRPGGGGGGSTLRRLAALGVLAAVWLCAGPARAEVSVLTMTPGPHLFERFGHTALRVGDRVYNFGTFDGDDPKLVRKFLGRRIDYWLSVRSLMDHYISYDNRLITEQVLALDPDEERALAARLEDNAQPDKRAYRYDFFLDNCATRVRDAVDAAVGGAVARAGTAPTQQTYRRLVEEVLAGPPLLGAGVSLLLNASTDVPLTRWEAAFLPRELQALLADAVRSDGRKLVSVTRVHRGGRARQVESGHRLGRVVDSAIGAVLVAALCLPVILSTTAGGARRRRRMLGAALVGAGLLGGLLGLVLLVTSLTPYPCARANDRLLLFHPGLLVLLPAGVALLRGLPQARSLRVAQAVLLLGVVAALVDLFVFGGPRQGIDPAGAMAFCCAGVALACGRVRRAPVDDPPPPPPPGAGE